MPDTPRQVKSTRKAVAKSVAQKVAKRDRAAILLADDAMKPVQHTKRSDQAIADELGISRQSITRWKRDPEFQAMIQDAKSRIIADAIRLPIAQKHDRIKRLNDLYESYWEIIRLRAKRHAAALEDSPANATLAEFGYSTPAEAATGLLVAQPKIAANGKTVVEWAFDKSVDSAIKEAMKQAAQETGQWEENVNINHGGSIDHRFHNDRLDAVADDDRLAKIEALLTGDNV